MKRMLVGALSLNNRHFTDMFLESFYRSKQYDIADSLIIDNGSTEDILSLKEEYPYTEFIRFDKNIGVAPGWNVLLKKGYELTAVCNNDLYLNPNFCKLMIEFADENPRGGMMSPYVEDCRIHEAAVVQQRYDMVNRIYMNENQIMGALYHTYAPWAPNDAHHYTDGFDGYCNIIEKKYKGQILPQALGSCFVIRKSTLDEVGFFEEVLADTSVGVSEDFDYSWRLRNCKDEHGNEKWLQIMDHSCAVHHFSSQTRKNDGLMKQYYGINGAQWEAQRHENTKRVWGEDLKERK